MKNKHLLLIGLMVIHIGLSPTHIWEQTSPAAANQLTETLSGRVVLKFDGTPELGTRIWIFDEKSGKQYTAQQNVKGEFSITLPEGYYVVLVTRAYPLCKGDTTRTRSPNQPDGKTKS